MDYITFGSGERNLLILPGLGDGLRTVKGAAVPFSLLYRSFSNDFKIYAFSRKEPLEEQAGTREMAEDVLKAMDLLGIHKTSVLGVSMGGMIAQHLEALCPDRIEKLVLAVTTPRCNSMMKETIEGWISSAEAGDIKQLMIDTAERTYTGKQLRQYRRMYPLLSLYPKPKSFRRFLIMAQACLNHDSSAELQKIKAPTLVIGGLQDKVLGIEGSKEIAEQISNCQYYIYEQYGHGLYDESEDFQERVLNFLK